MLRANILVGIVLASALPAAGGEDLPLHGATVLHFASVEEGREALRTEDRFTDAVSQFDLESRLGKRGASKEELLKFAADQVRPWPEDLQTKIAAATAKVREQLQPFSVPFPKRILLIHTTGKEEGNAAYCRRHAIILPPNTLRKNVEQVERLLAHELFHVLSSHNDKLRRELYGVVGFRECPPIALPENYRARKLTNPDAPQINNVIELELKKGEAKVLATPLLYASVDRYDPDKGGSFFKYLKFALMVVRAKDDCFEPIVKDGELELLSPRETPDYFRQIGRNTRYIIHPDEILADNFVWMVRGKKELSNPEIVEKMSRLFKQEQQEQDEP